MKRFAMIVLAAATLVGGVGVASAQMHGGGGMHGGGSMHSGGGWHGGGGWQGGGGWHGGGWHGGNWQGGWHGGGWHGGGWHGGGWHGGYWGRWWGWGWGGWGWGWWPWAPAWGWGWGWPVATWDSSAWYPTVDYSATYVQRDVPATGQFSQVPQYLYYCPDAGYYPQVPTCARGWLRVLPPGAPDPGAPVQY